MRGLQLESRVYICMFECIVCAAGCEGEHVHVVVVVVFVCLFVCWGGVDVCIAFTSQYALRLLSVMLFVFLWHSIS